MKSELIYMFACEYASIDNNGRANASGIFTAMTFETLPAIKPLYVVGEFIWSKDIETMSIELISPDGETLGKSTLAKAKTADEGREDASGFLADFSPELVKRGNYSGRILVNDEIAFEKRLFEIM